MCFFFFNDTATTEIYTLSLHDALPIFGEGIEVLGRPGRRAIREPRRVHDADRGDGEGGAGFGHGPSMASERRNVGTSQVAGLRVESHRVAVAWRLVGEGPGDVYRHADDVVRDRHREWGERGA